MRIFVVVTALQGVINDVYGFTQGYQADYIADKKRTELGIVHGSEGESENAVEAFEVDVDTNLSW